MPKKLNHITVAVSNLDRSLVFYQEIIGCTPLVRWDGGAYLSLDDLWLCLSVGLPIPSNDYSHIAFSIDSTELNHYQTLVKKDLIVLWKENQSEGESIYLLDPDGNKLELHCGDLQSRLASLKDKPYPGLKWY